MTALLKKNKQRKKQQQNLNQFASRKWKLIGCGEFREMNQPVEYKSSKKEVRLKMHIICSLQLVIFYHRISRNSLCSNTFHWFFFNNFVLNDQLPVTVNETMCFLCFWLNLQMPFFFFFFFFFFFLLPRCIDVQLLPRSAGLFWKYVVKCSKSLSFVLSLNCCWCDKPENIQSMGIYFFQIVSMMRKKTKHYCC